MPIEKGGFDRGATENRVRRNGADARIKSSMCAGYTAEPKAREGRGRCAERPRRAGFGDNVLTPVIAPTPRQKSLPSGGKAKMKDEG
jgi:hypothetical protein